MHQYFESLCRLSPAHGTFVCRSVSFLVDGVETRPERGVAGAGGRVAVEVTDLDRGVTDLGRRDTSWPPPPRRFMRFCASAFGFANCTTNTLSS